MTADIPYRNSEGYSDPTAYHAMSRVQDEQDRADARCNQLIKVIKNTADLAGFDITNRIELVDRETGRVYR